MNENRVAGSVTANTVAGLKQYGQSVWLDYIRRSLIASGELKRLVEEDGLAGVTSNPAIFEKAIEGSNDYAAAIDEIAKQDPGLDAKKVYERLAIKDIQDAADVLRPVYESTQSHDGYVSLEVSPDLANDTDATIAEARHLWNAVARPNVMIKVPATPAGLPAIRTLIGEGININVTLLFARDAYEAVAHAYIEGLEARVRDGQPIARIASVASFFVSRIDTAADALLEAKLKADEKDRGRLEPLLGKVAIANAKLAYQSYKKIFSGPRWEALQEKGAQTQRVLWASTGTKNPAYSDVKYVEALIAPDTVTTLPPETLAAYRDHGEPALRLPQAATKAKAELAELAKRLGAVGIDWSTVGPKLEEQGLKKFVEPHESLLATLRTRMAALRK